MSQLAATLVRPSVPDQPSWAHVVRGATNAGPLLPHVPVPPPQPLSAPTVRKLCKPITAGGFSLQNPG